VALLGGEAGAFGEVHVRELAREHRVLAHGNTV
jgi:hypothetical protein